MRWMFIVITCKPNGFFEKKKSPILYIGQKLKMINYLINLANVLPLSVSTLTM